MSIFVISLRHNLHWFIRLAVSQWSEIETFNQICSVPYIDSIFWTCMRFTLEFFRYLNPQKLLSKITRNHQSFCSLKMLKKSLNHHVQLYDWYWLLKKSFVCFESLNLAIFRMIFLRIDHCVRAILSSYQLIWGHSITTWTRWGGKGSKSSVFVYTQGIKTVRGGIKKW